MSGDGLKSVVSISGCSEVLRKAITQKVSQFIDELNIFFNFKLANVNLCLIKDRNELDQLMNKKTSNWQMAVLKRGALYAFHPDSIEKVSINKKKDFYPLIKHELCHIYVLAKYKLGIEWLDEGIAVYLSQKYIFEHQKDFVTKNALSLDKLFDTNTKYSKSNIFYAQSYFLVKYLVEKFGAKTITEFLNTLDSAPQKDYTTFKKIFYEFFSINCDEFVAVVMNAA